MEIRQYIDERVREAFSLRFWNQCSGFIGVVKRLAIDQAHNVEPRTGDIMVLAESKWRGYRHRCWSQRRDERPLSAHVMGFWEQFTLRRTSNNRLQPFLIFYLVGQIGMPTFEASPLERRR